MAQDNSEVTVTVGVRLGRLEAMEKARQIVDAWIDNPPKKANGYTVDGYRTPTLEERTDAIIKLAEFLWEPTDLPPAQLTFPSEPTRLVPPDGAPDAL